jgi:heavy metal efflux system protein
MIDTLIRLSVKHKLAVALLLIGLIGWGSYALTQLPIDAVPDITNNQVQVVTVSPSLAPQEVDQYITFPVELVMANLPDVEEVRSVSKFGLSVVTIVFAPDRPLLEARQLVSEQIAAAAGDIPPGLGTPAMMPITTGLGEIYQYTLQPQPGYEHQYDPIELRTIQDWIVKRYLTGIDGIVEISSFGGYVKQYEVAVDPLRLRNYQLSVSDVYAALATNNQNVGGSYIEQGANAFYIRSEGMVRSRAEIGEILIAQRGELPVRIADVATVGIGHPPRFGAMTANGRGEAVGGITLMLKGANSSQVIQRVKDRIAEVQQSLPEGLRIEPYLDRSELVGRAIRTVRNNLVEGGLIVIFVLVLLLGNVRGGLIVASVIPLAMMFAFGMMHVFGVSANLMSLGPSTLA